MTTKDRYDVIVVGSGAAGGIAAKVLSEGGARVVMLEAGPDLTDPDAAHHYEGIAGEDLLAVMLEKARAAKDLLKQGLESMGNLAFGRPTISALGHLRGTQDIAPARLELDRQHVQRNCRGYRLGSESLYVDDLDHPFMTPAGQPFLWIRGRLLGGRTQTWKRITPRLGDGDLSAASRDGYGSPWPLTAGELQPHYEAVERVARVTGAVEYGAPPYPGALPQRPMTETERAFKRAVESRWPERRVSLAPFASPLGPREDPSTLDDRIEDPTGGRWPTHDCSVRHSIALARKTGNLEIRTGAVARHILLHPGSDRPRGVAYVDAESKQLIEVEARAIVLCASTLESTRILLNTGGGFANSSGLLGHCLRDHLFGVGAVGIKYEPYTLQGFPTMLIRPFRNVGNHRAETFLRSYQVSCEVNSLRAGPFRRWSKVMVLSAQGEVITHPDNRVTIARDVTDAYGIPVLRIEFTRSKNDLAMAKDMLRTCEEMLSQAGYDLLLQSPEPLLPGLSVHELGTARMGTDARTSVLDPWARCWDTPNLYVTDGAAFPSGGCQNPTLTIMALTRRAAGHILERLASGEL